MTSADLTRSFAAVICLLVCSACGVNSHAAEGIHVNGRGAIDAVPDMGTVNLHVRREGSDPAALERGLNDVVSEVLALTRRLGIAEEDVTAARVSITPRYQRRDNDTVIDGVTATSTVTVTLRQLSDYPTLLTDSLELGVNNVDPIMLDSSHRSELEAQALDLAMADAQARGDRVAAGFGVKRGQVIDVNVMGNSPVPRMAMQEMRVGASDAAFAPGTMRIEQTLQATFTIVGE